MHSSPCSPLSPYPLCKASLGSHICPHKKQKSADAASSGKAKLSVWAGSVPAPAWSLHFANQYRPPQRDRLLIETKVTFLWVQRKEGRGPCWREVGEVLRPMGRTGWEWEEGWESPWPGRGPFRYQESMQWKMLRCQQVAV